MAVTNNTTTSADINFSLDKEMVQNFDQEYTRLADILEIFSPEILGAGTTLYQLKVTGKLDTAGSGASYVEGEEVALSKYQVNKTPISTITLKPWRKLTTAQAIAKSGYESAVLRTDKKMLNDVRNDVLNEFFVALKKGTGSATGKNLQEVLANIDATLGNALETNGDTLANSVTFINREDAAAYLGVQPITTQTLFGMTYLESFLGVERVFLTNKVEKGSVIKTPIENIHVYGADFSALASASLTYMTSDNGLIGVSHVPTYNRVSAETNVLSGMVIFPEITDYIVKGTIAPSV